MPLAERVKPTKIQRFNRSLSQTLRRAETVIRGGGFEILISLMIIVNIFVAMKTVLGIMVILYFLDKWHINDLILEISRPRLENKTTVCQEVSKTALKQEEE